MQQDKISDLPEKTTPVSADMVEIESPSDSSSKHVTLANLPKGFSANSMEGNVIKNGGVDTEQLAANAVDPTKTSATTYTANVSTSGTVTSSSYANFPTNRCYVDVVTANSNAKVLISYTADTAYGAATGSAYMRFTLSNANTGNATYERRAQNSDASQRVPITYTEIVTLASAGTTRVEVQLRGSSTSACVAENVFLSAQVLQD